MTKNQIENVSEAEKDKVKQAISRWNLYLFSKESDKNLFEYFLESIKKTNIINQYPTVFLENCILFALNKMETTPMHHNMRLKQSFQFLLENTIAFASTEEILTELYEKSVTFKTPQPRPFNSFRNSDRWFSNFRTLGNYKDNKNKEISKFILEKVLEKTNLEVTLNHYMRLEENLLLEAGTILASALIQKIENNPMLSDDLVLYIDYMEDKAKQLTLLDNIVLSPKVTDSEMLTGCWDIYSDKEKENVINKSLIIESQNIALEKLSGYRKYVKNILESDLDGKNIVRCGKGINKKKINLYFSLLEEIYNSAESHTAIRESVKNYVREMYVKIIEEKRPDLAKGLISIDTGKSIIQAEDVPLFVYQVMLHFPKLVGYHLINELLENVKKIGKIQEFSEVFNTEKSFEIGKYRFQFNNDMKEEIKYIYYHYLTDMLTEEKKNDMSKPKKRSKI